MRFLIFTKGDRSVPSSRYRGYYLAEALEAIGYETSVTPATEYSFHAFVRYFRALMGAKRTDVIYLQRTIYNKYFSVAVMLARICGKHFVFDLDDAVFDHSPWKTTFFVWFADRVTCGSELILSWARRYNQHSSLLENGLPLSIYTSRDCEPQGVPIIGWVGSRPIDYLPMLKPAFEELAKKDIRFHVRIIGAMGDNDIRDVFRDVANVEIVDSLTWSDPSEVVAEIKKFTIGIMPLPGGSQPWNQAKYFKALEYMACGVPTIVSPGATVRAIVEAADSGFIASNTDEWVNHFTQLLRDPLLRREKGESGRRIIEAEYSTDAAARKLVAYVRPAASVEARL